MLFARFRSKARDVDTDSARVVPLRNAVTDALQAAEDEFRGLRQRLDDATSRAAFLFGSELDSEVRNDPKAEASLAEAEQFLVRGQMRYRYLERQIALFHEILKNLDLIASPQSTAAEIASAKK